MHTHTTAGLAVACMAEGLSYTNFYAAQLHDMVAYHEFEGITVHAEEGGRLLKSIGDRRLLILRNHGLLSHGVTLAHAFALLWTLNRACEIQVATHSMRGEILPIAPAVCARATPRFPAVRPGSRRRPECARRADPPSRPARSVVPELG